MDPQAKRGGRQTPLGLLGMVGLGMVIAGSAASSAGNSVDVVDHILTMADADEDGVVSSEEYTSAGLDAYGVSFEDCDLDGDGVLTYEEYRELYDTHHEEPVDEIDV